MLDKVEESITAISLDVICYKYYPSFHVVCLQAGHRSTRGDMKDTREQQRTNQTIKEVFVTDNILFFSLNTEIEQSKYFEVWKLPILIAPCHPPRTSL